MRFGCVRVSVASCTFVGCRSFFGVESRVRMGMLVMLGFLGVFAVRVVGLGPCFLLLAFCHAGSVSTSL